MHFVVIAAFALVLSARTPTRSWWLFDSAWMTYGFVGGQVLLIALLSLVSGLWVMRRLRRRPWDADPAQRLFGWSGSLIRTLVLVFLGLDVLATPWPELVRKTWGLGKIVAVDDLVTMLPFFLGIIVSWAVQYPADSAIRNLAMERSEADGGSPRRIWRLSDYLIFNIRHQLLLIVVPMVGILIAYDLAAKYSDKLWQWTQLDWAEQAALMISAGFMFLISPVILRYVWSTRVLPDGPLRQGLQAICDQVGLKYRQILIWQSDGVVVNAAVMGLVPRFRYVLLSDGLLETMKTEQIEAVFGHEAGHVKHLHIHFYLLFAALSMLIVGGLLLIVYNYFPYNYWKGWLHVTRAEWNNTVDLVAMGLVLLCWIFGFGWVSRRFERQADIFGVRCVGQIMPGCDRECVVHHPPAGTKERVRRKALCPGAADVFAEALHRIAVLNGIAPKARSWRHSSIASRMDFVRALAADPKKYRKFKRTIILTKALLVLGTAAGCAYGAYYYWPEHFIAYWTPRVTRWFLG
ncbi:MAG: M48 family metalloprotease [Phycisphaerae bacterium]|nr:M48 family metalloprotease [Phycisphaerae bacterium]